MIEGRTEQETLAITMEVLGVSEDRAREIIAIESGQSDGDEVIEPAN